MNKKLIWLMGGMASGKSTLRRALCAVLGTSEPELIATDEVEYTDFGEIVCVGNCILNKGCDGLDKSFSRLKKDGGIKSVEYCLRKQKSVVVLEGSQTSVKWIEPLMDICQQTNTDFHVILLDYSYWSNLMRLKQRIEEKGGTEKDITDNKIDSVLGKNHQFRGIFAKIPDSVNKLRIDCENIELEEKVIKVLQFIGVM